jgi:hypothetical protein
MPGVIAFMAAAMSLLVSALNAGIVTLLFSP